MRLARVLDSSFRIPGTDFRIGLDAIIGLIPGVGDAATAGASLYILLRAKRLGVRKRTLYRMAGSTAIDFLVGSIPLVGDLFDAGYRANEKNVRRLEKDLRRGSARAR